MKKPSKILLVVLSLGLPMWASAANVTLTASDANGLVTSLNGVGKWSDGQAPSAANDYYTSSFFIRTPADTSGGITYTFAGKSLTLQQPGAGVSRSIILKGANNDTFIINNLTNALGGNLENGGSGNVVATFTGNQYTIAANSAITADQGSMIIGYPLVGATGVVLTNAGGNAGGITYNGDNSGFKGIFYLSPVNFGNGGGNMKVILNAANGQPGNPASPTPNQIWITAGSTLQDNIGLPFTNANGGFLLNGPGTATISASGTTLISELITDQTNGVRSICGLTSAGGGTLVLSNANNNYSGGTIISVGTLQLGVDNAIPGNAIAGDVTDNANLDLNTHNATINGLNGAGTVDTTTGGTPKLTVGANGNNGTFSGTIQNSSGVLSLIKVGAGTQTFSGGFTYSGNTVVAGGTLNLNTANSLPPTPGSLTVSNGATLNVNASGGTALPENNIVLGNSTVSFTLNPAATGINAAGNLTFQDNATNNFAFGTLTGNPTAPGINVAGGISAPGSNVIINVTATGLQVGTFTLIKYGTGTLANLANFQLNPPPGVAATLVNNTSGKSIDVNVSSIPGQLVWNGVNGAAWDLSTANWANTIAGGITIFQQYTNGSVIAGDAVTFDDTLTNDFVNPQPTNINLTSKFFAFPVVVNSSLPYTIAGVGGITGVTSLLKTNIGSLTLLTSNSFTGGVAIGGGNLIITNDSALGAASGALTLNSGTLQINGGVTNSRPVSLLAASTIAVATNMTASLGGAISGTGGSITKTDNGTLILTARETFTGDLFLHNGFTIIDTGFSLTNGSYHDVGQSTTDAATLTLRGTGSLLTTSDFNVGDLDSSTGTLNVQGSATLTMNAFYIGSANLAGSTASGIVNQSGGTVTETSGTVGTFSIGGRTSTSGVGVYNMSGGTLTGTAGIRVGGTGIGTLNQSGGQINALGGINIARIAGSFGTNNLNGGTLTTFNVATSTGVNAVFNFNGGTLQAGFNPQTTTWFSGGILAYVQSGGAFIDSSNFNVTISTPLLAGSPSGGLTKKGAGTLTLSGVNTFTGPITNNAGPLLLNSASTYAGGLVVNSGIVQFNSATVISGPTLVTNGATLAVTQVGSTPVTVGNLTLNGAATGSGAVLSLTPGAANNPGVAMMNCGTLTLNGTNTFSLAAVNVGAFALVKYTGTLAGSGNCTNLTLPQGATGFVSNSVASSTLYAVITSTGPGLVWTGTNAAALNVWDINITTNWTVNLIPTSYHQIISPGDAVIFNDIGSGTVLLNSNAAPASIIISNSSKTYTFSGTGGMSGPGALLKVGSGTAILNLTNDTYAGSTIISNGALQIANNGIGSSISSGNLIIGNSGTLSLSAQQVNVVTTVGELTGGGQINYSGGFNSILSFGGSVGGTWNGTIRDANGGGLSLTKSGTGTWVVGGTNNLNNSDFFNAVSQNQFNGGTTIITNGGLLSIPNTELWIAQGLGSTSTVVVAGGTIIVSNDWFVVGRGDATANGTLVVNSGKIIKRGANNLIVGSTGATGSLIVNGGQVLTDSELLLGENATANATLYLNGGVLQAADIRPNGAAPAVSTAFFNGGTLSASSNSPNFLQVNSLVMSNSLVLDDNGFTLSLISALADGDGLGGGLVKKGTGTVYLDTGNTYTGPTIITNGTLAGSGSVNGPLVVAPAGNLGAGDAGGLGSFTINNNLALQGNATLRINKTGGSPSQDSVIVGGNIAYGGILTVTNVTTDATPLVLGDSFQLFQTNGATLVSGNFTGIVGSPGAGLGYSFTPASGILTVVNGVNTTPTNIIARVNGGNLELSWPTDHTGWRLQVQTNALTAGLGTNWADVPNATAVNSVTNVINPVRGAVFYRMVYP